MIMRKKILLLGSSGKMGTSLCRVLGAQYHIVGLTRGDFDALDFNRVRKIIGEQSPHVVINTIAYVGLEPCEKEPELAFRLNALFPRLLAELSEEAGFLLLHFSTDAVFNSNKGDFLTENDSPQPVNMYGYTKFGGDSFITALAAKYYIVRISLQFGEASHTRQFAEKIIQRVREGSRHLRIADDIIMSPTYSMDTAAEIKRIIESSLPYGLYHIANEGKASLYDLVSVIKENLKLSVDIERASYRDFPSLGIKNTFTPIKSAKLKDLRNWKEAVKAYCDEINLKQPGDTDAG